MKVLVIDDSRAMRAILSKIMSELGFDVVTAADGREGLDRLGEDDGIGLVLVDWNLPGMNGYELVKAVRRDPAWDEVRLIMVTTETERENVSRAMDAGADEYVMKPFTKDVLLEKLVFLGLVKES
ncbi:MAG: response regulator [Acidobacteria bacterium]|nr:response regulator [Acidobacteriota bacterium]